MALGASRNGVVSMVMREGAMLACVGSLLGLGGAYVVGRAIRTTLYDVGAFDLQHSAPWPLFCSLRHWWRASFPLAVRHPLNPCRRCVRNNAFARIDPLGSI